MSYCNSLEEEENKSINNTWHLYHALKLAKHFTYIISFLSDFFHN